MNILVINSGSSSIKYQYVNAASSKSIFKGVIDRINSNTPKIKTSIFSDDKWIDIDLDRDLAVDDYEDLFYEIKETLICNKVINSVRDIKVIGHRVVHGGDKFIDAVFIDDKVKYSIKEMSVLAPLHNPYNLRGVEVSEKIFSESMQVGVFDTSFHSTIPETAHRYAIAEEFYKNKSIRVYGFHGISHKYVSTLACDYLQSKALKIISIHLGNGSSISAIKKGKCIDTSMGFSPIGGLIMGTRSGDIDISILFYLMKNFRYSIEQIEDILNNKSGMMAITGTSDMRDIIKLLKSEDKKAKLLYDMYSYRIRKYIGSYIAALNGVDTIILTGGIGENDSIVREYIFENMDCFGIFLDKKKNKSYSSGIGEIQKDISKVKILVVPTNEELEIAMQSWNLLKRQ